MLGWVIFIHAITLILRNFISAIRVFWAPFFIALAFFFLFLHLSGLDLAYLSAIRENFGWGKKIELPEGAVLRFFFPWFFVLLVINGILTMWGITAWHRHILLGEYRYGIVPPFSILRIGGYFLRALLLATVSLVLFVPATFLIFGAFQFFGQFSVLLGFAAMIVPAVFFALILFRCSLILPAYAVGNPISLAESWRAWRKIQNPNRMIFVLIAVNSIAQGLLQTGIEKMADMPAYQGPVGVAAQFFVFLLNVTILTTLYGYVVENRSLD